MARRRVNHHPARLIEHEHILIFVKDVQWNRLWAQFPWLGWRNLHHHLLPRMQPIRRLAWHVVYRHPTAANEALSL
jgi:hypothetical protein